MLCFITFISFIFPRQLNNWKWLSCNIFSLSFFKLKIMLEISCIVPLIIFTHFEKKNNTGLQLDWEKIAFYLYLLCSAIFQPRRGIVLKINLHFLSSLFFTFLVQASQHIFFFTLLQCLPSKKNGHHFKLPEGRSHICSFVHSPQSCFPLASDEKLRGRCCWLFLSIYS